MEKYPIKYREFKNLQISTEKNQNNYSNKFFKQL